MCCSVSALAGVAQLEWQEDCNQRSLTVSVAAVLSAAVTESRSNVSTHTSY